MVRVPFITGVFRVVYYFLYLHQFQLHSSFYNHNNKNNSYNNNSFCFVLICERLKGMTTVLLVGAS